MARQHLRADRVGDTRRAAVGLRHQSQVADVTPSLLLVMKGAFAEWAWRRSKLAGAAVAAVLLCSSAGAWPFNMRHVFTGEPTLGAAPVPVRA